MGFIPTFSFAGRSVLIFSGLVSFIGGTYIPFFVSLLLDVVFIFFIEVWHEILWFTIFCILITDCLLISFVFFLYFLDLEYGSYCETPPSKSSYELLVHLENTPDPTFYETFIFFSPLLLFLFFVYSIRLALVLVFLGFRAFYLFFCLLLILSLSVCYLYLYYFC